MRLVSGAERGRDFLPQTWESDGNVQECFRDKEVNLNEPEDVLLPDPR